MAIRPVSLIVAASVLGLTATSVLAQSQGSDDKSSFRLEFLGTDPAVAWPKAISALVDKNLIPIESLTLRQGQNPCGAVLEQLHFRALGLACSDEMEALIKKLNPNMPSPAPVGQIVRYPNLRVEEIKWQAGFDTAITEEKDRAEKVDSIWKKRKIDETAAGSVRHLQFKGVATDLNVATIPKNYKALETVEQYNRNIDRYETRAIAVDREKPIKRGFSLLTPVDWAKKCVQPPIPAPPTPPYISLLNKLTNPTCMASCEQPGSPGCPEIVLIDQAVEAHPDLAPALGRPAGAQPVQWCPFGPFDAKHNHGTHLAGIMVSRGSVTGFQGVAPNASLDSEDIPDAAIKRLLNDKFSQSRLTIYVYASKFANDYTILNNSTRLHKPPQVEDMLASRGLWVVAAGQEAEGGKEIGKLTTDSPMNLGDQSNVLVVTACEHCYSDQVRIANWANYSEDGLVNVAAPGGSDGRQIPSTVSATQYGLAHGTSQATALVGGLAAAMASCYPQRYTNGLFLKERLLTTAQPPRSEVIAGKISTGIIDAQMATLDPEVHWIKLAGDTQKRAKEVWFCRDQLRLKDVDSGEELEPISAKNIRRIVKRTIDGGEPGWNVFYEKVTGNSRAIKVTPIARLVDNDGSAAASKPLLYVRGGEATLTRNPIGIGQIEDLLISFNRGKVPPDMRGCSQ